VKTSEFRVNRYGAPTYPELVLVVRRDELEKNRAEVRDALAALEDGTRAVLKDQRSAIGAVATASGGTRAAIAAQLAAVRPALSPPIRLQPASLAGWASFDTRFGILSRPPDLAKAFDTTVAP
jgi:putative hydroxymethylpyrimidine transport system substrate-binding protein